MVTALVGSCEATRLTSTGEARDGPDDSTKTGGAFHSWRGRARKPGRLWSVQVAVTVAVNLDETRSEYQSIPKKAQVNAMRT